MDLPEEFDRPRGLRGFVRRLAEARRHGSSVARRASRLGYATHYLRWRLTGRIGPVLRHAGPERATAILQSFARPQNMGPLVASLRRCAFIDRVLVVNNHPRVRIGDWVTTADPRVVQFDTEVARPPIHRFDVAAGEPAKYFVMLDDDLFLTPRQVAHLFARLVSEPDVPHGFFGQRLLSADAERHADAFQCSVTRCDGEVDVLNRAYFVTREHVARALSLRTAVARRAPDLDVAFTDDMLLSVAARRRPRIHDVGPFLDCPTQGVTGVAVFTRPGTGALRVRAMREMRAAVADLPA